MNALMVLKSVSLNQNYSLLSNASQVHQDVKKISLLSKILPTHSMDGHLPLEVADLQLLHALMM
eukprot:CAMPEP_0114587708 /NCGR_PEP_ID=MMETSP0125-20121206/10608_1 /TAXON_ID=485358 ORGANISM="Aristerostoma sp., Strain ATCC 50986" /NCGR_SAMPLE_ID=MMETSP0125 /ASSEMBLY_ACC=CAM_ASM_000245 /LENGTH=63 /DNA_ID=CAMNT_0001783769 /DNA_START=968 /DNA_END=1159 /DNA_ORIENTATION=-